MLLFTHTETNEENSVLAKIIMTAIMFVFVALALGLPVGLATASLSESVGTFVWLALTSAITGVLSHFAFKE